MKETLIIDNFAGIKYLELEYKNINILIGPQASGKSICVKLTYFFKNFFSEIFKSLDKEESKRELDNRQKEKFITYFPKESWPKDAFRIEYRINNTYLSVDKGANNALNFRYSDNLKKIINKNRKFLQEERKKIEQDPKSSIYKVSTVSRSKFYECLANEISDIAANNHFFIPAGRSFFANIQTGIFSFLSDNRSLDPFLIEFGSFYEQFKRIALDIFQERKKKGASMDELISQIMNGTYHREKDKDFLIHQDSRKVNLTYASSGQQETLPLLIVLKALTIVRFSPGRGATIYIEEPEAHLFPIAQKRIVQLLARTFNSIDTNFQIIVTTHSPYILSSFNNLLEAGKIIEKRPEMLNEVIKIVPSEEILSPSDVIAYSLNQGKLSVLIDENTKLISQNILDSASDEIAEEFGKLIDIEFEI